MVEEQLVKYIREQLRDRRSEEAIRSHLIGYGYPIREIDDAIDIAKGVPIGPFLPEPKIEKTPKKEPAPEVSEEMSQKRENILITIFSEWLFALVTPGVFFKKIKGSAGFIDSIMKTFVAGFTGGLIVSTYVFFILTFTDLEISPVVFTTTASMGKVFISVAEMAKLPVTIFLGWLVISSAVYFFASMLGGKKDFRQNAAMISVVAAPVMMIASILSIILPLKFVPVSFFILFVMSLYPVIIATREAHEFGTLKAALSVVIPLAIVIVFLIPAYEVIFEALKTLFIG